MKNKSRGFAWIGFLVTVVVIASGAYVITRSSDSNVPVVDALRASQSGLVTSDTSVVTGDCMPPVDLTTGPLPLLYDDNLKDLIPQTEVAGYTLERSVASPVPGRAWIVSASYSKIGASGTYKYSFPLSMSSLGYNQSCIYKQIMHNAPVGAELPNIPIDEFGWKGYVIYDKNGYLIKLEAVKGQVQISVGTGRVDGLTTEGVSQILRSIQPAVK